MKHTQPVAAHQDDHPTEDRSYYYLSDQGQVVYIPAGQDLGPGRLTHPLQHSRLSRPSSLPGSHDRSPSVSSVISSSSATTGRSASLKRSNSSDSSRSSRLGGPSSLSTTPARKRVSECVARLGLPRDWIIYPLIKSSHAGEFVHDLSAPFCRAFCMGKGNSHDPQPSEEKDALDFRDLDPSQIDYGSPLSFEISTKFATPAPSYHLQQSISFPPSYSHTHPILPQLDLGETFRVPNFGLAEVDETKQHRTEPARAPVSHSDQVDDDFPSTPDLPKKPNLEHSRDLPRDFTERELHQIRRNTRHCIRVVTRSSIGLAATTALSCVAPQLLIAAAINAYCLGRGAHRLCQQLDFLKTNELRVRKKDVILAVAEGVAIKIAFMAITINHDDFIVLTHELLASHASPLVDLLQAHPIPGIHALNEYFIKPMESSEESLGLPTMADRAAAEGVLAGSGLGTMFGSGGWGNSDVALLVENVFLVGSVQAGMERAVDEVQDRIGKLFDVLKRKLDRTRDKVNKCKEEKTSGKVKRRVDANGVETAVLSQEKHVSQDLRKFGSTEMITLSVLVQRTRKRYPDDVAATRKPSFTQRGNPKDRGARADVKHDQRNKKCTRSAQ